MSDIKLFLDQLPLSDVEKHRLNLLDVDSPTELYELISLSIKDFEIYFGRERTHHLIRHLYPIIKK